METCFTIGPLEALGLGLCEDFLEAGTFLPFGLGLRAAIFASRFLPLGLGLREVFLAEGTFFPFGLCAREFLLAAGTFDLFALGEFDVWFCAPGAFVLFECCFDVVKKSGVRAAAENMSGTGDFFPRPAPPLPCADFIVLFLCDVCCASS